MEEMHLDDSDSGDISVNSDDDNSDEAVEKAQEFEKPSETRMIREMGEGIRALASARPAPVRHEPAAKKTPEITRPKTLYGYYVVQPIPVSEVKTNKKRERQDQEMVQPETIQVLFLSVIRFILTI